MYQNISKQVISETQIFRGVKSPTGVDISPKIRSNTRDISNYLQAFVISAVKCKLESPSKEFARLHNLPKNCKKSSLIMLMQHLY